MRIAILGGSTPFLTPLFAELAARAPAAELVLHGRSERALAAVAAHARHVLSAPVAATTSLPEAIADADVIVHQIRYGDLAGRAADEVLSAELGAAADETLGPGALQATLRAGPGVRAVAAEIARLNPQAFVVNLTNPLSATTALFATAGLSVIGLCELPEVTAQSAAMLVGHEFLWDYVGLNHRGFLHGFGDDDLDMLGSRLGSRERLGVLGDEVRELGALPLKYFGLFADHQPHGAGRAHVLMAMRAAAIDELRADPRSAPASIAGRSMPWWEESVGPALGAILTESTREAIVNVPDPDGVVRERRVLLHGTSCTPLPSAPPPPTIDDWLQRFEAHERAVLDVLDEPSAANLRRACEADPVLPAASVDRAVTLLSRV